MNISVAHLLGTFQAFGVLISILNGFTFFSELLQGQRRSPNG